MRKLKEAFYLAAKGQLPSNRSEINAAFIKRFVLGNDIDSWYPVPGFMAWFHRDEAVSDRLNRLYQLRLDAIEEILEDNSSAYTARDKLAAGTELDKIAKTLIEAEGALDNHKVAPTKSMEEMIQEALDKARQTMTPGQIAEKDKQTVTIHHNDVTLPI